MSNPQAIKSTLGHSKGLAGGLPGLQAGRGAFVVLILVAATVVISLISAPGPEGLLGAGLAIVTIAIAIIDWRRFVIPNWLNAVGLALALLHAAVQRPDAPLLAVSIAIVQATLLALMFLVLRHGYALIRKRQGLGLGDVKLAAVAGAWLDWPVIPIAIEIAAFAALTVYLAHAFIAGRSITPTKRIPFGTFLAPAIWVTWLIDVVLLQI